MKGSGKGTIQVLVRYLSGGIEENHEKSQSEATNDGPEIRTRYLPNTRIESQACSVPSFKRIGRHIADSTDLTDDREPCLPVAGGSESFQFLNVVYWLVLGFPLTNGEKFCTVTLVVSNPGMRSMVTSNTGGDGKRWLTLVEEWKTNLIVTCILFNLLCAQHVSDINISIFRNLRLCWWITTSVVLFSIRCVLEFLLRLIFGGVRFAGWSTTVLQPAK